ncbi:MAG: 23S rRNA (adenine(2030)-N(6))-methyltransferase RlmJ [Methylotetracoccus sp.]
MLSYRHGYHAGNFADVFKHVVLMLLFDALHRKEKACVFIDTHAGAGDYDLQSAMALKNREFETGIARIQRHSEQPEIVRRFLSSVGYNDGSASPRRYPGSPLQAFSRLRAQDRMLLFELHPAELGCLRALFAGQRRVGVHPIDAYQGLKAFLPPPERRGLVLIDPAYERKDERARVTEGLLAAWTRWPTGMFAIWHPIVDRTTTDGWYRRLRRTEIGNMLSLELRIEARHHADRMNSTGMIIVNPPWRLDTQLAALMPWLSSALSDEGGASGWRIDWLTPAR